MNASETDFKIQTIARLFQTAIFEKEDNIKITKNTLKLVNEYLKLFTTEAVLRSNEHRIGQQEQQDDVFERDNQVVGEGDKTLDAKDIEAVSGLLVLDF